MKRTRRIEFVRYTRRQSQPYDDRDGGENAAAGDDWRISRWNIVEQTDDETPKSAGSTARTSRWHRWFEWLLWI